MRSEIDTPRPGPARARDALAIALTAFAFTIAGACGLFERSSDWLSALVAGLAAAIVFPTVLILSRRWGQWRDR